MSEMNAQLLIAIANETPPTAFAGRMSSINDVLVDDDYDDDDIDNIVISAMLYGKSKTTCTENYCEQVVPKYSDEEFTKNFRINRPLYKNLCVRFANHKIYTDLRDDKRIAASKNLLIFLWFAGHEACSFRDVGDRFGVCISTVSCVISRVTMFISGLSGEVIQWPNSEQKKETASGFERKNGFPKVIGAIDGTHIVIDPPKDNKDDYIDRKGHCTISLQGICNDKNKFIDVFIGFPGSVHDSRVFQNSFIYNRLQTVCKDYYLLGDSAYPLQNHLLTPYKDNGHLSARQKLYNRQLSSGRVAIEHTFGILKQRFRQLYYCKLRGLDKLCHFVRACCVLHNLSNENEIAVMEDGSPIDDTEETANSSSSHATSEAKLLRDSISKLLWNKKLMQSELETGVLHNKGPSAH